MPLPIISNTAGATKDVIKDRAGTLTKNIVNSINPKETVGKGIGIVKGQVVSEIPELSGFAGGIGSFFSDIIGDIKNRQSNMSGSSDIEQEQVQEIKQIRIETKEQSDMFDALIFWLKQVDSNLHGSPPYLLTISEQLEDIHQELRMLVDTTVDAWDLNREVYDIQRAQYKLRKTQLRNDKFKMQKEKAKIIKKSPVDLSNKHADRRQNALIKFLENSFIFRIVQGFSGILIPILEFLGVSKLAKGFAGSRLGKGISKTVVAPVAGLTRKSGKKLKRAFKSAKGNKLTRTLGKGAKMIGAPLAGVGSVLKGAGKVLGPIAIYTLAAEMIFGGLKRAINEYMAGNGWKRIVTEGIKGAIFTPIQGMFNIVGSLFNLNVPDIEKVTMSFIKDAKIKTVEFVSELYNTIKTFFIELKDSAKQLFTFVKDDITETVKRSLTRAKDAITLDNAIPDPIERYLGFKKAQPSLGRLESYDPKQQTAANIIVEQKQSDYFEAELKRLNAIYGNSQAGNVVAPVTTNNISTTNVIPGNIHTRNPMAPAGRNDKKSY